MFDTGGLHYICITLASTILYTHSPRAHLEAHFRIQHKASGHVWINYRFDLVEVGRNGIT